MDWIGLPPADRTRRLVSTLRRAILATGFWGAIVLPLFGIPLLAVAPASADVVAIVLVVNVVCLVVGQRHDPATGWFADSGDHPPIREGVR